MEDLLSRVERPSRYLGTEVNAVKKDLSRVSVKVALAYPDLYEIGMSNTGLHILYHMLNESPDVACERAYLPAPDLERLLRAEARPLTTLENRIPLGDVDILGIQIPHELAFANIVKMIRLAGLPLWAAARRDHDPLILGGGPGVFGAEPVAPFYDAMLLGDAEEALWEIVEVVREHRASSLPRAALLARLAKITGVYVPSFYDVRYHDDGRVAAIEPKPGAPPLVLKALVQDLEGAYYPDKAIVPYADTVHNRLPIEVMRGCTVGCRFCQAGMIYRPVRERSPRRILDLAKCGLSSSGFEDISLLSLDTGDYTLIDPLTKDLLELTSAKRVALSLPSLRAGSLTDDVIRDVTRVRRTSFTIAPEAGTQRLRDVINKNISDEEIFETVERVAKNGWTGIKLYFMVGFPTETQADLDGLVELVTRCRDIAQRFVRRFECTASVGVLVPKPHTPFQWDAQLSLDEGAARVKYIARALKYRRISCKFHDPPHSWMEGIFSRGDRRLAPAIAAAEARGAAYELGEQLGPEVWREVLAEHGLEPDWYLRRRDYDEVLPWDHLSARVTKKFLHNDRLKVDRMAEPTTFDCRDDLCAGCSVCFTDDIRNRLAKYQKDPFSDGRRLPIALTSTAVLNPAVARQVEQKKRVKDQAAKSGADALEAKRRRKRPAQPGERRWHVTPGAPGAAGPADAFLSPEDEGTSVPEPFVVRDPEPPAGDGVREPQRNRTMRPSPPPTEQGDLPVHFRVRYERRGDLRWLAHLEVMRAFYHVAQRLDLPIRYTEGYHPKPKLAFGPPLSVGAESLCEELDLYLNEDAAPEEILRQLRLVTPPGLNVVEVTRGSGKSAHSERVGARWSIDVTSIGLDGDAARAALLRWEDPSRSLVIRVDRPGKARSAVAGTKVREVDLRQIVGDVRLIDDTRLEFDVRQDVGSAKPWEVVATLTGLEVARARDGRYLLISALRREAAGVAATTGDAEEPETESA